MEHRKILQGIIIGSIFTSLALAIVAYIIVIIDDSVGHFGIEPSDFWWLAVMLGFGLGLLFGGFTGGSIAALKLNSTKGILFGLLFSIFIVLLFLVWTGGGWDNVTKNFSVAFIVIAVINGFLVSIVTGQSSK